MSTGLRQLSLVDIPAAMELCREAGWNQTGDDWRMLLDLDREACFGLHIDGELAATTTLLCYGSTLGWIGMVLTRKRFQRRGCARILVQHAMQVAFKRGIQTLKLDATDGGAGLYTSLGFTDEQPVERWVCTRPQATGVSGAARSGAISQQLDLQAFAADRTLLLEALTRRGRVSTADDAYAFTRGGSVAHYLGPCVALTRSNAYIAIERAISDGGLWFWDLMPRNADAVGLAGAFGFTPVRRLRRMSLGRTLLGKDHTVFALAGFELG